MGSVAGSYMRKGCLIHEEMCKYLTIYEETVSHIWLCNRSLLNFLKYERKIWISFLSVRGSPPLYEWLTIQFILLNFCIFCQARLRWPFLCWWCSFPIVFLCNVPGIIQSLLFSPSFCSPSRQNKAKHGNRQLSTYSVIPYPWSHPPPPLLAQAQSTQSCNRWFLAYIQWWG